MGVLLLQVCVELGLLLFKFCGKFLAHHIRLLGDLTQWIFNHVSFFEQLHRHTCTIGGLDALDFLNGVQNVVAAGVFRPVAVGIFQSATIDNSVHTVAFIDRQILAHQILVKNGCLECIKLFELDDFFLFNFSLFNTVFQFLVLGKAHVGAGRQPESGNNEENEHDDEGGARFLLACLRHGHHLRAGITAEAPFNSKKPVDNLGKSKPQGFRVNSTGAQTGIGRKGARLIQCTIGTTCLRLATTISS